MPSRDKTVFEPCGGKVERKAMPLVRCISAPPRACWAPNPGEDLEPSVTGRGVTDRPRRPSPGSIGEPVLGRYGAGECAAGVFGEVCVGSGSALARALLFGRVAGRSGARAADEEEPT
jgi:hypothetical protein